jgi:hypothetical protein
LLALARPNAMAPLKRHSLELDPVHSFPIVSEID